MVVASMPVVSLSRLAARPVGAQRTSSSPLALSTCTMALTSVVFPTPGPPVMTITLDRTAVPMASRWAAASGKPILPSTHATAFPTSMGGHGCFPCDSAIRFSASVRSAWSSGARYTSGSPSLICPCTSRFPSSRGRRRLR